MNGIRANLFAENSVRLFFYRAPARDEKAEGLWIAHGLTYREEIETNVSSLTNEECHLFFYRAPARDEKAEGLWIAHGLTYREEIETRES